MFDHGPKVSEGLNEATGFLLEQDSPAGGGRLGQPDLTPGEAQFANGFIYQSPASPLQATVPVYGHPM
jgi:hypothetical protein